MLRRPYLAVSYFRGSRLLSVLRFTRTKKRATESLFFRRVERDSGKRDGEEGLFSSSWGHLLSISASSFFLTTVHAWSSFGKGQP